MNQNSCWHENVAYANRLVITQMTVHDGLFGRVFSPTQSQFDMYWQSWFCFCFPPAPPNPQVSKVIGIDLLTDWGNH